MPVSPGRGTPGAPGGLASQERQQRRASMPPIWDTLRAQPPLQPHLAPLFSTPTARYG